MKKLLLALIGFYRKHLSGLKKRPCCVYIPSCSQYAADAIETRGVIIGSLLAVWRLLRCNPFSRGGYDPVPEKGFFHKVIRYKDFSAEKNGTHAHEKES